MGLDMYLYRNSRVNNELKNELEGKTIKWDEKRLQELKDNFTITIAREGNEKPIPESILKIGTKFYINQEGFIIADIIKELRPDINLDDIYNVDCIQNENGSFEINIILDKGKNEIIFLKPGEEKKYTVTSLDTAYIYNSEEIMYWRKANQIRQWFVNNLKETVENCEETSTSKEELEKLIKDCKYILENKEKAKDIIPTSKGFFFGGSEYDEYYYDEIERTMKAIEDIVENTDWDNETIIYTEWW